MQVYHNIWCYNVYWCNRSEADGRTQGSRRAFLEAYGGGGPKDISSLAEKLIEGLDDCKLSYDTQYALIDAHPIEDYYFAGVVALEAAKIRRLFAPDEASELLSLIAEQVDAVAERKDRIVSDLLFFMVGRVEQAAHVDQQKMPHDEVVRALLQRMGVDRSEETLHLMRAILYRHELGEPLALGVPQWWQMFRTKYALAGKLENSWVSSPATPSPAARKAPRRAIALM
jgi:hypothetical protein